MLKPISIVIPYKFIDHELYLWVQKRQTSDELSGLLEFPGGKIENGETPAMAGIREVNEEVGVDIENIKLLRNDTFDGNLLIYSFLFEDVSDIFAENGYILAKDLKSKTDKIMPNNQIIIGNIIEYFQVFGANRMS